MSVNECPNITTVVLALSNTTRSNGAYKKVHYHSQIFISDEDLLIARQHTIIGNRSK